MKHLLYNLVYGLKLAFFLPCKSQNFKISWDMLWGIVLFTLISQLISDYSMSEHDYKFNIWGFHFHVFTFSLVMFAGYLISKATKSTKKILHFPVVLYNGIWIIFFLSFLWAFKQPRWITGEIGDQIEVLFIIWSFLIAFRVIALYHSDAGAGKKLLCAGLSTIAMYILFVHTYMGAFYYYNGSSGDGYEEEKTRFDTLSAEELFNSQDGLLERALSRLPKSKKKTTDLYGIAFGSYAYQGVFKREVHYVDDKLKNTLKMEDRTVTMINDEETVLDIPVANSTNLQSALNYIGTIIQPKEDIVLIYLTSHGSAEQGLSVELDYRYSMLNLDGERFAKALENSGIKNKILIISACYSGAMIPFLEDENTMIITASANNKQSYGCADDADLTYFADAYFKKALAITTDLEKAFHIAKEFVEDREKREELSPPSDPQIFVGENIRAILQNYKPVPLVIPDDSDNKNDKKEKKSDE